MARLTTLPSDFREFVASLLAREVRFLVVGGHAVSVHAAPRFTDDFDVWVATGSENAARVVSALADFGFGSLGVTAADLATPGPILQLGRAPLRIDVLTELSGVAFEACYPLRVEVLLDGLAVPFIGAGCLRANKRASGRPKDLADLDALGDADAE